MDFILSDQLERDCLVIGSFQLSLVLLMNDASFPWVILVPKRVGVTEIYQLTEEDQRQLVHESSFVAKTLKELFGADKINIATLGNMVPQLHMHHIVRYKTDKAWPQPIWGRVCRQAYNEDQIRSLVTKLAEAFKAELVM